MFCHEISPYLWVLSLITIYFIWINRNVYYWLNTSTLCFQLPWVTPFFFWWMLQTCSCCSYSDIHQSMEMWEVGQTILNNWIHYPNQNNINWKIPYEWDSKIHSSIWICNIANSLLIHFVKYGGLQVCLNLNHNYHLCLNSVGPNEILCLNVGRNTGHLVLSNVMDNSCLCF